MRRIATPAGRLRRLSIAGRFVLAATAALVVAFAARLVATNHDIHISEVMAGANGNSRIQFIVIRQEAVDQNFWGPVANELQSRAMLVFFDASGRETGKFKFPANPPTGGSLRTLIATQEFASIPGAPAPNIIIPPLLNPISGKVCFKSNPQSTAAFPRNECLSYGAFTGDTEVNSGEDGLAAVAAGPPAPALSVTGTVSLRRGPADTGRNIDFAIVNSPTPQSISSQPFTIPVSSQVVQGENLFNTETFGGNGRTCASCHVAGLSFRLTPENIQSRFATVGTTFDPQFIGETAPSSFDAGFDFNLNTLTLTAAVGSNKPCTGELRGIITTPNGGRAKVLTRTSPTTYLVYGGRAPLMAGTVSDTGSCSGTVATVTAGSLGAIAGSGVNGLEDPRRMRTSAHPSFAQGRALILENIDGIGPPLSAPVFRKSPHLLNLSRSAPFGFGGDIPDLQTFVTGAVIQHFPRTLARSSTGANPDFRLPEPAERAAMEAFMLAQEFPSGSDPNKFDLSRFAITASQQRGRALFVGAAKCSQCHGGPVLAQTTVSILGKPVGVNAAFNTGVVNLAINAAAIDDLPPEAGGAREFSVPQLFNVRNLGPFFHDASAATLRSAVEFYASQAFQDSSAGIAIGGISITVDDITDITAFLEGLTANAAPTVSCIASLTTAEDTPTGAIACLLNDAETPAGDLTLSGTSSNQSLVPDANIAISGAGGSRTVRFTPLPDQFGSTTITMTVSDGNASGGVSFPLTVTSVNDPPSFTKGPNQTVPRNSGLRTIAAWATNLSAGPPNESAQTVSFQVVGNTNTSLFSVQPAVGPSGALTFTPGNTTGAATVTVVMKDSGGIANGGSDTSPSQAFTITVTPPPTLTLTPPALNFGIVNTNGAVTSATAAQTLALVQSGAGMLNWTASGSQPWISVSPASGTGPATITVSVSSAAAVLPPGSVSAGTVTVNAPGAANAPSASASLTVFGPTQNAGPVGAFDTPKDGIGGVTGSIAVTGWAIDDVGVVRVRVTRDAVPPEETAGTQIFIGNATFVNGARPDVAAIHAGRPLKDRAGWGYLLLTNFLPNRGNGTFTLHAFADDADGHTIEIGSKTITCTNADAILPFGAIDTPGQGETISGASFPNFGWVLSRGPALAFPPNGTVQVLIDGTFLPSPTGWAARPDLTALFPPDIYPGVTNALGVSTIDTTTLANGVHTIAWIVTDNFGRAEGIGSRFFTVLNSETGAPAAANDSVAPGGAAMSAAHTGPTRTLVDEVNSAPLDVSAIAGRRGHDLTAPLAEFAVGPSGHATVQGEELDRFELHVKSVEARLKPDATEITGYMRTGGELGPLPIGSRLDPESGEFTWQLGAGFLHDYDLVFVRWHAGVAVARREVRIVVNPRGSNRVGPQVVIDSPNPVRLKPDATGSVRLQPDLAQPFVVAGWAIDPDSSFDTGVETLHVWAYPTRDPAHPIFLGATAYGGSRPDVAAIYGDRFRPSGYSITVDSLPAGTYDVAVFAWSTATNGFVPAKVVRVTVR